MKEMVYILGGAQTDFARNWSKEGKTPLALLREVMDDCLKAVRLSYSDLEELKNENRLACFVGNFAGEEYTHQNHTGALLTEVHPAFIGAPSARYEAACASGSVALDAAICKLQLGVIDMAVVVGWELMKGVDSAHCGDILGGAAKYEQESKGVSFPFPTLFSGLADAMVEKYKLEPPRYCRDLAELAAINYENAKRNPLAQTRNWHMSREKAERRGTTTNPWVSGMLANTDCSQITDGAAAVVLVSERIRKALKRELPVVSGMGCRVAPMQLKDKLNFGTADPYILPWTRRTVVDAYRMAGLTVADIDVFEVHDCFTSSEYMEISALGLTEPGREFEAIESGLITFGGKKPINPSGGLIGCGHPVGASGVRMFLDISKQVAGTAGAYQVPGVRHAMMLNIGGSATTNYTYIVSAG